MNRKTDRRSIEQLIERLRLQIPHMAIRSTFLLGFPGETDDDFQEVMDFIENTPIDRAGAFAYSKEEGTPAADMEDQIADEIKGERVENFMAAQMLSSENLMEKHIGRTLEVLITEEGDGGYIGRSYLDAPDIDGIVTVQSEKVLEPGEFVYVEITEASAYDLGGIYIEHSK